jgi:hypothetical protein
MDLNVNMLCESQNVNTTVPQADVGPVIVTDSRRNGKSATLDEHLLAFFFSQ